MSGEATIPTVGAMIDRTAVLERFEGDVELMCEIAEMFLAQCPARLQAVRDAIALGDGRALQFAAHSLKGAVSNFAAKAALATALRLELMGRDGDLTHADDAYAVLSEELARLCRELRRLKEECTHTDARPGG